LEVAVLQEHGTPGVLALSEPEGAINALMLVQYFLRDM
jgi:hypothetical protein